MEAFQQNWTQKLVYDFPPFSMTNKNLNTELISTLILPAKTWDTQAWHPKILNLLSILLTSGLDGS